MSTYTSDIEEQASSPFRPHVPRSSSMDDFSSTVDVADSSDKPKMAKLKKKGEAEESRPLLDSGHIQSLTDSHRSTGSSEAGGKKFVYLLTVFSALGGFLFGYDTGVVSGAMLKIKSYFGLSNEWEELIVSVTVGAAALAAALAGPSCDLVGRKPVILLASCVFTAGAVVMAVAWAAVVLLVGRVLVGLGVGMAAMVVPMYIAEAAPADMRGKLVVLNNVFITGGQFVATVVDGSFSYLSDRLGWRYYSASIIQMAGFSVDAAIWLAVIPAFGNFLFTLVGLLLVDWLGRRKLWVLSNIGMILGFLLLASSFVLSDYYSPDATSLYTNGSCHYTSCGACVGNSMCGFCADYSSDGSGSVFNGTCSLGNDGRNGTPYSYFRPNDSVCGVFGDKGDNTYYQSRQSHQRSGNEFDYQNVTDGLERRWSFVSCPNNHFAALAIFSLFLYIAAFAPGMGPLPWAINAEIYPTWARSTAISIATTFNWSFNLVVSMTFLTLADLLGQPQTFGMYAGISFVGLFFVLLFLPETKGRSLEEMEDLFQRPYFLDCLCASCGTHSHKKTGSRTRKANSNSTTYTDDNMRDV